MVRYIRRVTTVGKFLPTGLAGATVGSPCMVQVPSLGPSTTGLGRLGELSSPYWLTYVNTYERATWGKVSVPPVTLTVIRIPGSTGMNPILYGGRLSLIRA